MFCRMIGRAPAGSCLFPAEERLSFPAPVRAAQCRGHEVGLDADPRMRGWVFRFCCIRSGAWCVHG